MRPLCHPRNITIEFDQAVYTALNHLNQSSIFQGIGDFKRKNYLLLSYRRAYLHTRSFIFRVQTKLRDTFENLLLVIFVLLWFAVLQ